MWRVHFVLPILFVVLYENVPISIVVLPTKRWYSSFSKKVFDFRKIYFSVKIMLNKTFEIFSDCLMKICRSIKEWVTGRIANEVLKMKKGIEFQCLWIVIYYKIHFRVLLHPIWAGEVTVVIVTDKSNNLVSSFKGNTIVNTMSNYHYFLLLKCNFLDILKNLWTKHYFSKTANGNMSRMYYTKVNFPI